MATSMETFAVSDDGFSLPVTDVLTGRGFVTGKSGSGKSNTASVIAEELLERDLPLLIVDTDGEYYGLADRYEVLHAGADDTCDLTVGIDDAERVATLALEENLPIILDVSGYLDEDDSRELLFEVVKALFHAEKTTKKPFLLLVEEAHEFIPQGGGSDDLSQMLVRVAKRGRKRGLGICALSQRPASVDKDYITQCDWLVWHRLTWENDTAVAERILGDDAAESVESLEDGEALVMTDWDESLDKIQFRRKRTYDAGATPDLEDSRRSSSAKSDLIDELSGSERSRRERSGEADEPTETDDVLPTVVDAQPVEPASSGSEQLEVSGDETDVTVESPASRQSSTSPVSSPHATTIERDPLWEVGHIVLHLYGFLVSSHRWLFTTVAGWLETRLESIGGPRRPTGPRRERRGGGALTGRRVGTDVEQGGRSSVERIARVLAATLILTFYVVVFTLIISLA